MFSKKKHKDSNLTIKECKAYSKKNRELYNIDLQIANLLYFKNVFSNLIHYPKKLYFLCTIYIVATPQKSPKIYMSD